MHNDTDINTNSLLIVYHGTFPWNRGVAQLYATLAEAGYSPTILAPSPKPDDDHPEAHEQFNIIDVAPEHEPHPTKLSPLDPRWFTSIVSAAKHLSVEALFVRDTPVSGWTLLAGKYLGVPVYLDMRENIAALYEAHSDSDRGTVERILKNKRLIRLAEASLLPRFRHIFTVSPELRQWLLSSYSLAPDDISVLGNYPTAAFLENANAAVSARQTIQSQPDIRLVFSGYVWKNRGLQDIVRALPLLSSELRERVKLSIIGEGHYLNEIKRIATACKVRGMLELTPLVSPNYLPVLLSEHNIGLCPYHLNELAHQTVPGKLFEYMAVGLPIFSSARRPVARIVEETGCGIIYNDNSPEGIAEHLDELIQQPEKAAAMGQKGREAVLQHYNWQTNIPKVQRVLSSSNV